MSYTPPFMPSTLEAAVHRIGFVVFPKFQVMGFAAITAFEIANLVLGEDAYEITLLSETGGLVKSSAGFAVETKAFGTLGFDTVMIGPATAHWGFARALQSRFPKLHVEEDRIYIIDGPVWTSAGMTAGIDLALAMIENDHGQ